MQNKTRSIRILLRTAEDMAFAVPLLPSGFHQIFLRDCLPLLIWIHGKTGEHKISKRLAGIFNKYASATLPADWLRYFVTSMLNAILGYYLPALYLRHFVAGPFCYPLPRPLVIRCIPRKEFAAVLRQLFQHVSNQPNVSPIILLSVTQFRRRASRQLRPPQ